MVEKTEEQLDAGEAVWREQFKNTSTRQLIGNIYDAMRAKEPLEGMSMTEKSIRWGDAMGAAVGDGYQPAEVVAKRMAEVHDKLFGKADNTDRTPLNENTWATVNHRLDALTALVLELARVRLPRDSPRIARLIAELEAAR